jgi:CheY-like chemotaxis protein
MSGMELLAALRELMPGVPVLLATATPAGTFPVAPGPAGGPGALVDGRPDGMLVKPFRPEQLLRAAVELAGRRT